MAKRPTSTLTLTARQRRELARAVREVRAFLDDPVALLERAAQLLRRPGAVE
jgi:hypothetical protein